MHARQTGSQLDTCTVRQEVQLGYNALILPLSFFLITQSLLCSCFFSSVSVSPSCLPAATPTLSCRDMTISSLRRSPHSHFLSASRPQTHLSVVSMMSHPEVLTHKPLKATCRASKSQKISILEFCVLLHSSENLHACKSSPCDVTKGTPTSPWLVTTIPARCWLRPRVFCQPYNNVEGPAKRKHKNLVFLAGGSKQRAKLSALWRILFRSYQALNT